MHPLTLSRSHSHSLTLSLSDSLPVSPSLPLSLALSGGICRAVGGREAVCDERERRGAHRRQRPYLTHHSYEESVVGFVRELTFAKRLNKLFRQVKRRRLRFAARTSGWGIREGCVGEGERPEPCFSTGKANAGLGSKGTRRPLA